MIEYELSVGSKCNSLKTNQVIENELGCPRAIHYLTPPPLAIFWGDVHVYKDLMTTCNLYLKKVFFCLLLYLIILVKFGLIFLC